MPRALRYDERLTCGHFHDTRGMGVANVYADKSRVTEAVVDRYYELTLREGNRHALGLRMQQLEPGAAIEREFDGKAGASVGGFDISAPADNGNSGFHALPNHLSCGLDS